MVLRTFSLFVINQLILFHFSGLCQNVGKSTLNPELMTKAQKYCKWAGSALTYDDVPTAINNLEKALRLLKTGVDS